MQEDISAALQDLHSKEFMAKCHAMRGEKLPVKKILLGAVICGFVVAGTFPNGGMLAAALVSAAWFYCYHIETIARKDVEKARIEAGAAAERLRLLCMSVGVPVPRIHDETPEPSAIRDAVIASPGPTEKRDVELPHGIRMEGGQFVYQSYRYDRLEDAIRYAELVKSRADK